MAKRPKGKEPKVKDAEDGATTAPMARPPRKPAPPLDENALIGKRVVDTDGLELGYVDGVRGDELRIGEGPFSEWLLLPMSFVGGVGEDVQLIEPLQELLKDVEVFDSRGRSLGWVSDVMATGDVVDGIIVKSPGDSHFVILENIRSFGGTITLDITLEQLKGQEGAGKK
jgi:sporulation protein YlmC with PRC-barrel domain